MRVRAIALAGLLAAAGCQALMGGGPSREETRTVAPFTGVKVSGALSLHAAAGRSPSLKVRWGEKYLPRLHTEVEGGVLRIFTDGGSYSSSPSIELTTPTLQSIEASGATRIRAEGLSGDVTLEVSGAADLTASGKAGTVNLETSGASHVDASGLSAERVTFDGSGACAVTVRASQSVKAKLSGACHLGIAGHPPEVKQETSGASSVSLVP